MMPNEAAIALPGHYISELFALIASRGPDTDTLCAQLGLAPNTLNDTYAQIPWATFRQLVQIAEQHFHDTSLGLLLGERLIINTHGPLGYAALSSTTLRQLIALLEQYLALRTDLFVLTSRVDAHYVWLQFEENRPLEGIRTPVTEAVLMAVRNVLDFATVGSIVITEVAMPCVGDSAIASAIFRSPVTYNAAWCGFKIPLQQLDLPLKMANASSYEEALLICQDELKKVAGNQKLSGDIRKLLLKSNNGFPSLESIARHFHMTKRTLHRHLVDEQTSYSEILDSVRHLLALRYLERQQMSIQEIAYVLGYTDIANFRRAFKRWQGVAPSQYQASLNQPD